MHKMYMNLDSIKRERIQKNMDFFIVIDGGEGTGKSSLELTICMYFENNKFDIKRICFTETDIYKCLYEIQKTQAMGIDEGENILLRREAMRRINREMVKTVMSDTRAKNILVIIVIPDILQLEEYIVKRLSKSGCWLHVVRRGIFKFYGGKTTYRFYREAKKTTDIRKIRLPTPAFIDTFDKVEGELWEKYEVKKLKKVDDNIRRKLITAERMDHEFVTVYEAAMLLAMPEDRILDAIKTEKITAEIDEGGAYKIEMKQINKLKDQYKKLKEDWKSYVQTKKT